MMRRAFVAGFATVLIVAPMLVPVESWARGGFVAGRAGSMRAGFPRSVMPRFVPRAPAVAVQPWTNARIAPLRRHHRDFGRGLPWVGVGMPSGSYPDPVYDVIGPPRIVPPAAQVLVFRRDCHPQVYTVPSEQGGRRDVTVTRCWLVGDAGVRAW